jgi:membrane-associated phospholipid phosphatase
MGILISVFHQTISNWGFYFVIHCLLILFILEVIRFVDLHPNQKSLLWFRILYPLVIFFYSWNELNVTVVMFFGNHWATDILVAIDKLIFGVHPTVWFSMWYNPLLDEMMNIFYAGYYLFAPIVLVPLFFLNKHSEIFATIAIVMFTFFTNFILFHFLPALGPQMIESIKALGSGEFSGYWVASITKFFQAKGSVKGACFPSSHISASVAWSLSALRYEKRIGIFLLPFTIGTSVSTVYLGYHHAIDPIAGFLWGISGFYGCLKILQLRNEDPKKSELY